MTNRQILISAASCVLLFALAGCGGSSKDAAKIKNALDGPTDVMTVYKANCVSCHGTGLQGRIGPTTNLQEIGARMSAADIIQQIEQGEQGEAYMPAFKDKLTEAEIVGLADWLASKK
ncbi:hypothetical protein BK133_16515 [Paenibacillus sp. FSL H8-0548]|uniref:c-type cytochrome n=1 Tax=Paenibacillus sp. FSL H8-0548 TaxID=1920422 RepID=UPI00096DED18|nr:cytochrome c [Paenibacillus sp. FSL H8-0548]OMF30881.1 hypothetical protein BK133_16515 [Paenibacillus sp. FSL H8-0548]